MASKKESKKKKESKINGESAYALKLKQTDLKRDEIHPTG